MKNLYNLKKLTVNHKNSLNQLSRAIAFSQGQFSLILVCSNFAPLQEQVMTELQAISSVEIQPLVLHPTIKTLLTTLQTAVEHQQPGALMVLGLESVIDLEQMLVSTNLLRNELREHFFFPLVLWVNDEILQKLIRIAPDFKNWATSTIRFEASSPQLIQEKAMIV